MSEETSSGENTYLFDTESAAEMARLIDQDRMLTKCMGGPLADQANPERFHTILDLGCGPGGWALDTAYAYPDSMIYGVDISQTMIAYANARARTQRINNVSFGIMDIRYRLDFADQSCDLINARLLVAVLLREDWPRLVEECKRLLKPGGVLRLTEADSSFSTSAACDKMQVMGIQLMDTVGYGFSPDGRTCGITPVLPRLLRKAGFVEIGSAAYTVRYSPFDEAYADIIGNTRVLASHARTLLIQSGRMTEEEFDKLYQQMELDMLSDDFYGIWPFLTVWGVKPQDTK